MVVRIVITDKVGNRKGVYSGNSLEELLASVHDGDTYEEVDAEYNLPELDMTADVHYKNNIVKRAKTDAVAAIVVVVNDKVFDGDEVSQGRMLRAIQIAAVTGESSTQWKLADNSIVEVTLAELKEALTRAGKEMSKIWLGE